MSAEEVSPPSPRRSRIVTTAALYFLLVFAVGLVLGPIRVLWLEPVFGQTIAVLCETPFLIGAMWFAARWTPRWTKLDGGWLSFAAVGLLALIFQQLADLTVGFGLRGMTLSDQLAFFATPPGYIYAADLILFAVAPIFARRRLIAADQDATPPAA